jgi:hypothetical protein
MRLLGPDPAPGAGAIVWLASYPKSGNTWLRALLTSVMYHDGETPDLNGLVGRSIVSERQYLDDWCGINSAEYPYADLLPYIRNMRAMVAEQAKGVVFEKTHDRFAKMANGLPSFPSEASRVAIYLVRNPMDVALSLAAHNGSIVDAAIAQMADPETISGNWAGQGNEFLPEYRGDWSGHVQSWLQQCEIPTLLVRYEDMVEDAARELSRVLKIVGMECHPRLVSDAVQACSFERLQGAESVQDFSEKPSTLPQFFRSGTPSAWRQQLSKAQQQAIYAAHGPLMEQLGYDCIFP